MELEPADLASPLSGDREAFDRVAEALRPALVGFAIANGAGQQAEDRVQDALTAAWARLETFQPDSDFAAWVFTILRHKLFERFRHETAAKRDRRRTEAWGERDVAAPVSHTRYIEHQELERDLHDCIRDTLTEAQKEFIALLLNDESVSEIGRRLDLPGLKAHNDFRRRIIPALRDCLEGKGHHDHE